ncbi:MAG: hypothetical protein IAA72_08690 [Spirochaetes bacterium]|uniref:Uncharacterized protein n=1 Tax=Candidatus Ornithospirochaeta stercoravium TaxID=2840897 RepID=A0A9D9ICK8_9SPIO|nr:hypothetical protein [Candidatus Ornithospirochaeta stercoravium]
MTLEEAKKEINRLADCLWSDFDKNPNKMTYGEAIAYEEVCHILDEIDTEPVGNPDKLTLNELAKELRKLFEFKYLTCDGCGDQRDYCIWLDKPEYTRDGWIVYTISSVVNSLLLFESYKLAIQLDLSEYKDADGNIDYSKCIVEVKE